MFRSILRMNVAAAVSWPRTMSAATSNPDPEAMAETLDKMEFGSSIWVSNNITWVSATKGQGSRSIYTTLAHIARDKNSAASTLDNAEQTTDPAKVETFDIPTAGDYQHDFDRHDFDSHSHWD